MRAVLALGLTALVAGQAAAQAVPTRRMVNSVMPRSVVTDNSADANSGYEVRESSGSSRYYPAVYPQTGGPLFPATAGTEIQGRAGYRTGRLSYSIAGTPAGTNPNVLSELKWDQLKMADMGGSIRHTIGSGPLKHVSVDVGGYYAYAISGENRDSDYAGDNRTAEFSRSNNDANGSTAFGGKGALGYSIPIIDRTNSTRVVVTPLVGYQYDSQRMKITEGNQTLCGYPGCSLGRFDGLNSRYNARWFGPFVGAELETGNTDHRLRVRGEFALLDYEGSAQWNLREDFQQPRSFSHDASGLGTTLSADYTYQIYPSTGVTLSAMWQNLKADEHGRDITYFSDGTVEETKLNEVHWLAQAYHVGLAQRF